MQQYKDIYYSLLLCYSKYPTDRFVATVKYDNPNAKWLHPASFDGFTMNDFTNNDPVVTGDVYICSSNNEKAANYMLEHKMARKKFGNYYLGVLK